MDKGVKKEKTLVKSKDEKSYKKAAKKEIIPAPRLLKEDEIEAFFKKLEALNPEPKTELNHTTPFSLLVAIILSAQATDKGVNKITPALFERASSPKEMLSLSIEELESFVKSINYYHTKARHILELAQVLVNDYDGKIPEDFETLITLPSVGRKTALVYLNITKDAPVIAVDTHVFRLCNRLGLCFGKSVLEVEKKLAKRVPDKYKSRAQHWLVLLGRYTCKAKKPLCETCPVSDLCLSPEKRV